MSQTNASEKRAKVLARQIAEEMLFSQEHGGSERRADIRQDIYAFGMVLDALLPGHRLVAECTAPNLYDRPDCFEFILEELQDLSDRRTWIGSLLIGVVIAALFLYRLGS